ncbi:CoA transferase [Gaiella sp.]|uniref:CaiB/BaiF CoA transferase family protein n=1 Tax=Gaiella sp. TaxID=2663207 RepID=UPI003266535A
MTGSDTRGPLAGVRVVAIEQYGAGPFGTMQLADLGAEVIKVEDPTVGGDVSRYVPPYREGTDSLFFESFNRNKKSVTLDLRHPEARAVLEDLVRVSDALVSNLRGDQPEKLRIRFADLEPVNPHIVCVSLSGFGMTGPRAGEGGYDYTVQGLTGWMALTGGPDQPPTKSGLSLVDFCGGYVAALATLAGVWQARRDGRGCDADLSLHETALAQLTYIGTWAASRGFEPRRMADSAHQTMVPFQAFRTADGWIMIACPKQRLWERFCAAIDMPELPGDPRFTDFTARDRNRDVLVPLLGEVLARRSTGDWLERMAAHGVPSGPVNDVQAALADPQAVARGSLAEYEHPTLGAVRGPSSPFRFDGEVPLQARGPTLGEHTHEVLRELCGYDESRLGHLAAAGVFGDTSKKEEQ